MLASRAVLFALAAAATELAVGGPFEEIRSERVETAGLVRGAGATALQEPPTGFSGVVTAGGSPLAGVRISIYSAPYQLLTFVAFTDANGAYALTGAAAGAYFAKTENTLGYVDEIFDDIPCMGLSLCSGGTPVQVEDGSMTTGIDFALDAGGRIAGTVTASEGGSPIEWCSVYIFDAYGSTLMYGLTDAAGNYITPSGLLPGNYYARADCWYGPIWEVYDDIPCVGSLCPAPTSGTAIAVGAGETMPGIDFALDAGGGIAGTVTASGRGTPIPQVLVHIYDSSGAEVTLGSSHDDGSYATSVGLPSGSYYARTSNYSGYRDEVYDDVACAACPVTSGSSIPVTAGVTTDGIDFELKGLLTLWRADAAADRAGPERRASARTRP